MAIFDFILSFPPVATIFLISLAISLAVTVIYKFTTNQKLMKRLQSEMKSLRDEIKNIKDPSKAASLNKRLMEKTMQQIMHSMRSTLLTVVPIFLIFAWMNASLAYSQAVPGEEFTASIEFEHEASGEANISSETLQILTSPSQQADGTSVRWNLTGDEGTHAITFAYGNEVYERKVIITEDWRYEDPVLEKRKTLLGLINIGDANPIKEESVIRKVSVDLEPTYPFGDLTLFGWRPGWLAAYFIFTLALTFPIRKLLRVH